MNPNYLINIDNLIKNPTQDLSEEPSKPKKPKKLKQKEIFYIKSQKMSGAK